MKDMAKRLSTAMLTALAIAHSKGDVLIGDDQRVALLGMAGRVSANTIYALQSDGLLRKTRDELGYELTIKGLSALGHAGVISPEEYTELRRKWDEWMDVAHAEALDMEQDRVANASAVEIFEEIAAENERAEHAGDVPEQLCPHGIDALRRCSICAEDTAASAPRALFIRRTRHGSETVKVERVHAGRVDYRVLDTRTGRVSAPYRMREKTFNANYAPVLSS